MSAYSDSNFVFNNLLTSDANATRFSTLTNSVSISDYTGFHQINIWVYKSDLNNMFYQGEGYNFDFVEDGTLATDLNNLTSNVINSSDGTTYYADNKYLFYASLDPNLTAQTINNVKSRASGPGSEWLGQMYTSNSNAIRNLDNFSNFEYAEVTSSGFFDILRKANGMEYDADKTNFYDQLLSANKWDAINLKMDLCAGDTLTFGIVFNISQQVNNTIPGFSPDGSGNYTFNYQGTSYTVPEVDICSAIITMCYAINFIAV